jgi:hypothetical protein
MMIKVLMTWTSTRSAVVLPRPVHRPGTGHDAHRPIHLQHDGARLRQIAEAMLTKRRVQLIARDPLAAHVAVEDLAVVDQQRRLAHQQPLSRAVPHSQFVQQPIEHEEDDCRDHPAEQRVVPVDHGVLDGVAEDHDEHQVVEAHLPELPLAQ